jgi:hypothetical protein
MKTLEVFNKVKEQNKKNKVLILGCGPSLSKITEDKVKELSKDHLIATIKQSYIPFGSYSDFQFFNCNNLIRYEGEKSKFICCSPNNQDCGLWSGQNIDMFFHMSNHPQKMKDVESDDYFFSIGNMGKYWGPGIMTEIVLSFFYNLGVKEIVTAGWDYSKDEGKYSHFYQESKRVMFLNPAQSLYLGENKESIMNSSRINSFFKKKGVSLSCVESEDCYLDDSITRISL